MKFDKDGNFIKTWGKKGSGAGRDRRPARASSWIGRGVCSSATATTTASRFFDQDGKFLDQWMQFSRPSGIAIDRQDERLCRRFRIGIRLQESRRLETRHQGRAAQDGAVTAFIPDPVEKATTTSAAEGIAVDAMGNIFGAEVATKRIDEIRQELVARSRVSSI